MSSSGGSAASTPSAASSSFPGVPRVGGVRCYWALMAPRYPNPAVPGSKLELVFVHPDPVLGVHLAAQRLSMMGRGLLEFIHPAEREQARYDLGNAISADDLQGSVTRVRFARLSWIRKILGGAPEDIAPVFDAALFAEDDQYLILDVVLNWVADGLLLAFFHAIKDKDPVQNNDPSRSNDEWTNYCGTASMGEDQIEALHTNISRTIPITPKTHFPPSRVFQLYTTPTSPIRPDSLIFSWPPPRTSDRSVKNDGQYEAGEYTDLMRGVNMDPSQHHSAASDIRTNCTTRYGATHSITTEGVFRHVSSVFIPYGSLIFACFQTTRQVELHRASSVSTVSASIPALPPAVPPSVPMGDSLSNGSGSASSGSASISGIVGTDAYGLMTPQQEWVVPPIPISAPPPVSAPAPMTSLPDWHQSPAQAHVQRIETYDAQTYPPPQPPPMQQPIFHPPPPSLQTQQVSSFSEHQRVYWDSKSPIFSKPPQQYDFTASYTTPSPSTHKQNVEQSPPVSSVPPTSTRPLIRPPGKVECCRICGLRESPEWRRSETGVKDLCNACGLRLARQVAKREGKHKPRKKVSKTASA